MALRINGEPVADSVIKEEERLIRPRLVEEMAQASPIEVETRVKLWARENIVERTVLRQEAMRDTEPIPEGVIENMMSEIREQSPGESGCVFPFGDEKLQQELTVRYRVEQLLGKITAKVSQPKNKDISDFYLKNKEQFATPETIHAAHIVKNVDENTDEAAARAAIEQAEAELKAGASFEELADRLSDCPGRGGDLGYFPRGQMVEEFEDVVFRMKPGEVSPIFRSPFGFHIAKLYQRVPEGTRDLQEVKAQISQTLLEQKRQRAIEQFLDRLMNTAKVEEIEMEEAQP
ncbi:MAG: peptidylprolyl isomerase [Acidobacteria bacterium]|nr:peptidylprolyl isomerase [Acidobacteriota bacterium]